MTYWILLSVAGFILAAAGLLFFYRKVCSGEMRLPCFLTYLVGFLSLLGYALITGLTPESAAGTVSLLILLPGLASIALIVRRRSLASDLK